MDKKKTIFFIRMVMYTLLFVLMMGCSTNTDETMGESKGITDIKKSIAAAVPDNLETATFAGGCFWCMEPPFEKLAGVYEVISGYTGGEKANPTYEQVSSGGTGHIEAVQIKYDPAKVSYETLLEVFWRQINPTDAGGQFVDRGYHYTSAIFYHNDIQKLAAEKSKEALATSGRLDKPIVTPIVALTIFYDAEEYHQDYYIKNPIRYKYYRGNSGRDAYLDKTWGEDREFAAEGKMDAYKDFNKEERLKQLTKLQFDVTQNDATERPFDNPYDKLTDEGIYVDIVSGEPLFSSVDKYDSRTGWPSFTKPLEPENIVYHEDRSIMGLRIEVRSKHADSHLGHVFDDGPAPTGLRFCMNSASMRFIPKADLEKEGYGHYAGLFK